MIYFILFGAGLSRSGFTIDWEHTFGENLPIYVQIFLGGTLSIYLSTMVIVRLNAES